mmetsp:Transcript_17882/g.33723  ORF Transcript_17882/g.33723 Transcript_17882/m.33723 type:complete len:105 (-) Transcript_17882:237-551(-)|eukprot:scaffold7475_cov174-Amphora_coffeaeformis.AAC.1
MDMGTQRIKSAAVWLAGSKIAAVLGLQQCKIEEDDSMQRRLLNPMNETKRNRVGLDGVQVLMTRLCQQGFKLAAKRRRKHSCQASRGARKGFSFHANPTTVVVK